MRFTWPCQAVLTCCSYLRRLFRADEANRTLDQASGSTSTSSSERSVYAQSLATGPLRQGEIISELRRAKLAIASVGNENSPLVNFENHPYAVVLTQDCDLDLDLKARNGQVKVDKMVPDVLFCIAVTADELKNSQGMTSRIWDQIGVHGHERYQVIGAVSAEVDLRQTGLPSLALDFKHHFSMPVDEVYRRIEISEAHRRTRLISPYLEHLSSRFARYQSRVALPEG